jgi:hypothetical protein
MLDLIVAYIGAGVAAVVVFSRPIREAVSNLQLVISLTKDNVQKWRFAAFSVLLTASSVLIWPFYLLVVYQKWKASQPMTIEAMERRDEWDKVRRPERYKDRQNRQPVSFTTPINYEQDKGRDKTGSTD